MPKIDPLLPVIFAGRPMHFNNLHRAKIIAEARRQDVTAIALEQIEFAQAEALQRRAWDDERAEGVSGSSKHSLIAAASLLGRK